MVFTIKRLCALKAYIIHFNILYTIKDAHLHSFNELIMWCDMKNTQPHVHNKNTYHIA